MTPELPDNTTSPAYNIHSSPIATRSIIAAADSEIIVTAQITRPGKIMKKRPNRSQAAPGSLLQTGRCRPCQRPLKRREPCNPTARFFNIPA
jgi:hypothetical protein